MPPRKMKSVLQTVSEESAPAASSGSEIYCLKCKAKTGTSNPSKHTTSNGRHMVKGVCEKCGCKKSKFVKA